MSKELKRELLMLLRLYESFFFEIGKRPIPSEFSKGMCCAASAFRLSRAYVFLGGHFGRDYYVGVPSCYDLVFTAHTTAKRCNWLRKRIGLAFYYYPDSF